ncbi:MAG TPA: hypothetical protein VGB87_04610 [Vicinamibacteria bacterium]
MPPRGRLAFLVLAALPAVGPAAGAQDAAPPADPLAGFGWLRDLAGSCWTTVLPGGTLRDTQCYEVRFGRFLAGSIRLEPVETAAKDPAAPKLPHGAGFAGENVCKAEDGGRIACWNWGSDGTFAPGAYVAEGDLFRYPLSRKPGSAAPEQRMTWKRLDADTVRVSREKKDGDAWTESFAVVYTRVRP